MQARTIIVIFIICVAVFGLGVYFFTRYTVNPAVIHFARVRVANSMVVLENGSFAGSSMWYSGYSTKYNNGVLSVKIQARSIKFPGATNDPFTISIPNTYGDIHKIRLSGGSNFQDRVIWVFPK